MLGCILGRACRPVFFLGPVSAGTAIPEGNQGLSSAQSSFRRCWSPAIGRKSVGPFYDRGSRMDYLLKEHPIHGLFFVKGLELKKIFHTGPRVSRPETSSVGNASARPWSDLARFLLTRINRRDGARGPSGGGQSPLS